jgi:DnaJ-class molecular chaperone
MSDETCAKCGANISDKRLHNQWHAGQSAAIRNAARTPCKRCKGSGKQPGLHNLCGRCGGSGKEAQS